MCVELGTFSSSAGDTGDIERPMSVSWKTL
jgi:hypothetical protein